MGVPRIAKAENPAHFLSRVGPVMENGCRLWTGALHKGYGWVRFEAKALFAHRVIYFLHHGTWPPVVRHSCDNPPCCEITHLLPGTQADNCRDMHDRKRNRQPCGEQSGMAKYTTEFVKTARSMYATGNWSERKLAAKLSMNRSTLNHIITRRIWRHIP